MSEYSIKADIDGSSEGFTAAVSKATESLDDLDSAYSKTTEGASDGQEKVSGGLKDWGINLDKLYEKGNTFFKSWGIDVDKLAGKLGTTGPFLTGVVAVGAAVFAVGKKIVASVSEWTDAFGDYEEKLKEVFTLLPSLSESAMDGMSNDVDEFSKKFGVLPTETIPALYQAISAGVPQDNVFDFLETAQKAATGGVSSLTTAVDALTSVTNAYGVDILSVADASDAIFTAVKDGKTTFDELASSLYNVIPTAAAIGINFDEVAASLAAITAQGTPTSVATTQVRQMLVELNKEGTSTSELFKKIAGESFKDFISSGGNVTDALSLMGEFSEENNLSISDLFSSVEAGNAALQLTGKGAASFAKILEDMGSKSGATEKAYATMTDTVAFSKAKYEATKEVLNKSLGELFAPLVQGFYDISTAIMNAFSVIADAIVEHEDILKILGISLASATVAFVAFSIALNFGSVVTALSSAFGVLAIAIKAITVALAANPFVAIATVITAVLVPAVIVLADKLGGWKVLFLEIQKIALIVGKAIVDFFSSVANSVVSIINVLIIAYNAVVGIIGIEQKPLINPVDISTALGLSEAIANVTEKIEDERKAKKDLEAQDKKTQDELDKNAEKQKGDIADITDATVESAKTRSEWEDKAATQAIASMEKTKDAAIDASIKRGDAAEDVYDIAKSFDDKILASYKTNLEAEKTAAIEAEKQKGVEKTATAEEINASILLITSFYETEITNFQEEQEEERVSLIEDYSEKREKAEKEASDEAEKLAEDRYKFEKEWNEKTSTNAVANIELERTTALDAAEALGASAKTVYEINKYYDDLRVDEFASSVSQILGYSNQLVGAIGGDGAEIVSDMTDVVSNIVLAFASGGTDIAAVMDAIVGVIGLAGDANEERMTEMQNALTDVGEQLLDVMAPALEFVLDILEMIMPVLELFMPLLDLIFSFLDPIFEILKPIMELWLMFNPVILLLKLLNPLLEVLSDWLGEVAIAFGIAGDMVTTFIGSGVDGIFDMMAPAVTAIKEFGSEVSTFAAGAMDDLKTAVDNVGTKLSALGAKAKTAGTAFTQSFIDGTLGKDIWSNISSSFTKLETKVKDIATKMKTAVSGVWDGLVAALKTPMNTFITAVNAMITAMNKISVTIPSWVPALGGKTFGINLASIPALAKGTDNFVGGVAMVGELGPELAVMPQGTQVKTARQTNDILANAGKKEYTVNANFYSPKSMNQREQMQALKRYNSSLAFQGAF